MPTPIRPDLLSGLVFWANSDTGVVLDSGVSVWHDQSGLGNDAHQSEVNRRATYLPDAGDDGSALVFDGIDDGFAPMGGIIEAASAHSILINCMPDSLDGSGCVPISVGHNSSSQSFLALYLNPVYDHAASVHFFDEAGVEADPPAVREYIAQGEFQQFLLRTGTLYRLRMGTDTTDVTADFSAGAGSTADQVTIGSLFFGAAYQGAFKGKIREVIIYNREITDGEWKGLLAWMLERSAGTPPDSFPPIVDNYSPTPGTPIGRTDPLFFDVTDDSGLFRRIIVTVSYPDGLVEVVHDGDSFTPHFLGLSERDPITNGWHYRLRRIGGWPGDPTIKAYAFDQSGNENP